MARALSGGRANVFIAQTAGDFRGTLMALAAGGTVDNSGTAYVPSGCIGFITKPINCDVRIAVDRAASTAVATTDGILGKDTEYTFAIAPYASYISMEAITNAGTARITYVVAGKRDLHEHQWA